MKNNYRNHNVKFYAVKKEHYQDGNCPTCACCGKSLRFVMQIDGVAYGYDCGAKMMEWNETVQKMVRRDIKDMGTSRALEILQRNEAFWTGK